MTNRLPTPGGDDNDWGDILNSFLEVSLTSTGTLQNGVVGTSQIQNNAVTNTQLDAPTQSAIASVANKYTKPSGGIPSTDLTTSVQTNLTAASTAIQQINTKTGTSVTLAASDVGAIPSSQLGASNGVATLTGTTLTGSQIPTTVVSGSSPNVPLANQSGTAFVNVPAWQPTTPYPQGFVVQEGGLLWSANTSFTSGSSFSAANWTAAASPVVENVNTVASSGSAQTIPDVTTDTLSLITLSANCTLTLPTPAAGKSLTVVTAQNATGGWTITWATPSGVIKWPGGATPTYTAAANAIDVTTFICADGTNWLGFPAGYNME